MKLSEKINKSHMGKTFKLIKNFKDHIYHFKGTVMFYKNRLVIGNKEKDEYWGYDITDKDIWDEIKEV